MMSILGRSATRSQELGIRVQFNLFTIDPKSVPQTDFLWTNDSLYKRSQPLKMVEQSISETNGVELGANSLLQLDKIVGMATLIAATTIFLYYTLWTLLMVCIIIH